jgi:hypothetical protein
MRSGLCAVEVFYGLKLKRSLKEINSLKASLRSTCMGSYVDESNYDKRAIRIFNLENDIIRINNILEGVKVIRKHVATLKLKRIQKIKTKKVMLDRLLNSFEGVENDLLR